MAKNPRGNWGPYGGKGPAFAPFAWAFVNGDGTFAASSENLSMLKGSDGNYILQPLDDAGNPLHYPVQALIPFAIVSQGIPFTASPTYGLGPTSDGIQVLIYNGSDSPAVAADAAFYFALFTARGFF